MISVYSSNYVGPVYVCEPKRALNPHRMMRGKCDRCKRFQKDGAYCKECGHVLVFRNSVPAPISPEEVAAFCPSFDMHVLVQGNSDENVHSNLPDYRDSHVYSIKAPAWGLAYAVECTMFDHHTITSEIHRLQCSPAFAYLHKVYGRDNVYVTWAAWTSLKPKREESE